MQEWIPVSTSAKGRLAVRALEEFGRRGYAGVNVAELAADAGVTTGSLYHHFGSKNGLYDFVRREAEQRLVDRMEGAAAASAEYGRASVTRSALLVGFDFAVSGGFLRLLGEPRPDGKVDPIADILASITDGGHTPLGAMLAAAWRAALLAIADGIDAAGARAGLAALALDEAALRLPAPRPPE